MERAGTEPDSLRAGGSWGEVQTPDDVETMRRLRGLGWGTRRIASELGCSRNTVRRWLSLDGWQPYGRPQRRSALDGLEAWLAERFHRHAGNADVVHQELVAEHGIPVSLRTVERAVAGWRRDLAAAARATMRFETLLYSERAAFDPIAMTGRSALALLEELTQSGAIVSHE